MELQILPLAITMMAGPQIMSAIVFVTTENAVRVSLAFVAGVVIAVTLGVAVTTTLFRLLGSGGALGDPSQPSSIGNIIQIALIALLLIAAVKSYLGREAAKPPRWLGTLLSASPGTALRTGLLVIALMPSDLVVMLTVGLNLAHHQAPLTDALPFIALTALIAALPLLAYLLFHRRAVQVMPRVRDWMSTHSWLVNIVVYCIFILLILRA